MLALVHREPGEGIEIHFSPWRLFVIAVAELQRALAALGYPTGEADGTFGERTHAAVAAFQARSANGALRELL